MLVIKSIKSARRRQRGVTLIDTLIAIVILSVMLSSLAVAALSVVNTNLQARRTTAAATLAHDKLEQLRALGAAAVADGADPQALDETGASGTVGAIYNRRWTVTNNPGGGRIVTVILDWTDKTGSHSRQLQTLLVED